MVNDYKIALERLQRKRATTRDITLYFEDEETNEAIIEEVAIYNKLYEHENQEEELGVDWTTLFEVNKKGAYFKKTMKHYLATVDLKHKCIRLTNHHVAEDDFDCEYVMFKDYGKTWALTKEELE